MWTLVPTDDRPNPSGTGHSDFDEKCPACKAPEHMWCLDEFDCALTTQVHQGRRDVANASLTAAYEQQAAEPVKAGRLRLLRELRSVKQ